MSLLLLWMAVVRVIMKMVSVYSVEVNVAATPPLLALTLLVLSAGDRDKVVDGWLAGVVLMQPAAVAEL